MQLHEVHPQRVTLSNGVQLLVVRMPHLHHTLLEAQVRTGSRFETPHDNGLSHFLEHMLYRGTPRHPTANAQALAFERLGATLMAATAKDYGSLQVAPPCERFFDVLPLVGEVFSEPLLAGGLEIERGIVREEILETLDEKGTVIDPDEVLSALAFPDHPLGYTITGAVEQLAHFDTQALKRHHDRFYVGAATTVTAAGPLDVDRTLQALQAVFGTIPRGERAEVVAPAEQQGARFRFVDNSGSQTSIRIGFRAPSFRSASEAATQILLRLIDDGLSTRLYEHLCDRHGLCYDVGACYEAYEDAGLVHLSAECANGSTARVLEELLAVVRLLRDSGPSKDELDKAKQRHGWQLESMLDSAEEVASHFGFNALMLREQSLSARREELSSVTAEQVVAAAREVFSPRHLSAIGVGAQTKRQRERLRELACGFE